MFKIENETTVARVYLMQPFVTNLKLKSSVGLEYLKYGLRCPDCSNNDHYCKSAIFQVLASIDVYLYVAVVH